MNELQLLKIERAEDGFYMDFNSCVWEAKSLNCVVKAQQQTVNCRAMPCHTNFIWRNKNGNQESETKEQTNEVEMQAEKESYRANNFLATLYGFWRTRKR